MNYYPTVNHHHMVGESQFYYPPPHLMDIPKPSTNRFIYVKHNFINPNPAPPTKVLVNPHFKKKVFVNPQFHAPQTLLPTTKPKIHVNPNVLKNFGNNVPNIKPTPVVESKTTTVISTRNKLVRIPCNSPDTSPRKRRNSLHTKYKIVRSGAKNSPINKFKLDKRNSVNKPILKTVKKRYVYVNRFLSMDVVAKNVLLKKNSNLCKPGFVNINGILYKKSPNSLKKASESLLKPKLTLKANSFKRNQSFRVQSSSKYKLVRKDTKQHLSTSSNRRSLVRRYKVIRSKKTPVKPSPSKLRKCNIPCPIFRKYGRCPGKTTGTCFKLHNPDQIVLCTRFLQGACRNENCLLSHKVSHEKMPTCKYYLDGLCSKDNCPYLHVKISPKADICRDFLEGFCKRAAECDKRHQFLCPDFEKSRTCAKRRCPYPHGNVVRKNSKVLNTLAKKCFVKKEKKKRVVTESLVKEVSEKNRYYKDSAKDSSAKLDSVGEQPVIKTVSRERPKLGDLPAFIPLFEGT
ncbi:zinc finger CCCH domain-containing protein 3 isoform X1 [Zophobas morio]|uniref:zinc finger CCCH domain-containing protein 3 isoform X1 n=1 Tax=Zophobas morio TaxID=2755281 RepID=UPI003083ECD4